MRTLKGTTGKLRAVVYSPDGSKLATAGDTGVTKLLDVASGRELATILQPDIEANWRADDKRVGRLAFSSDGKLLATATRFIRIWEVATAKEVPFPEGLGESRAPTMAFTPDDASLIIARAWSVGAGRSIVANLFTWNRKTGVFEMSFGEERDTPEAIAVSVNANLLAVALQRHDSHNNRVRLWDLTTKQETGKIDLPPVPMAHLRAVIQDMAISPDGRTIAVAAGMRVFVCDVAGKRYRAGLDVHDSQVSSVAFAPNSRLLATASLDGSVRFWDVTTLAELASYDWKLGRLRAVVFSPDGLTAAVVGEKARAVIWDVDEGLLS